MALKQGTTMRDYGKISTGIWHSKKFRGLDETIKLFYLYLHTCKHGNSAGCFHLPKGYILADMQWSLDAIGRAMDRAMDRGLISYNNDEEVIKIHDFLEHSPISNPKHAAGTIKIVLSLPECHEKNMTINELKKIPYCQKIKELMSIDSPMHSPMDSPMDTTETERKKESKKESKKERKKESKIREYFFKGDTIKLNAKDYEIWQHRFSAIPDFNATLHSADSWISGKSEKERKGWFHAVPQYLNNKHQKHLNDPAKGPKLGFQL